MRKHIIVLVLLAFTVLGCKSTKTKPAAGSTVTVKPKPVIVVTNAPIMADGLPAENSWLSKEQIAELKRRLDRLEVGMPRTIVLKILDVPSFNVRYFEHANTTGMTIQIRSEHTLSLGFKPADYDPVFRWAKFDLETWPKPSKKQLTNQVPPMDKKVIAPRQQQF